MSYFIETTINLGDVRENSRERIVFRLAPGAPKIEGLSASCGCSTPKYNSKDNTVVVKYNVGQVPYHLKPQGFAYTMKSVFVHFENGEQDTLTFSARVVV